MGFRTTTVGDMLEGFIDNMSDEQIDKELKLFGKIAKELKDGKNNYAGLGVLIDEDHMIGEEEMSSLEQLLGYRPYREQNRQSGYLFLYFETPEHAEIAAASLKRLFDE